MASQNRPTSRYLIGVYDDDQKLLGAVPAIRGRGLHITDAFTPFPIHGLDHALGLKRSRLPTAAFLFGSFGFLCAITMQVWMSAIDWPINVGGKPYLALPSFVPVTFELTVLIASLGMVACYLFANRLAPGIKAELYDIRQTDDRFVLLLPAGGPNSPEAARAALAETGAIDIREVDAYAPQAMIRPIAPGAAPAPTH